MLRARKETNVEIEEQATDVVGLLAWMDKLMAGIPDEELDKIPTDLSVNFDHYAYGHPKQQP
jgi:hypothetical protein